VRRSISSILWGVVTRMGNVSEYMLVLALCLVSNLTVVSDVITGSIASSGTRWYLIYSEADFEVFRPAGATRCTDGCEIWRG